MAAPGREETWAEVANRLGLDSVTDEDLKDEEKGEEYERRVYEALRANSHLVVKFVCPHCPGFGGHASYGALLDHAREYSSGAGRAAVKGSHRDLVTYLTTALKRLAPDQ